MKRLENWEKYFSDYLTEVRFKPFKWGENDCVLFAAKGLEVITGVNTYSDFLGYKNKKQAVEILTSKGGMDSIVSEHLGPGHRSVMKAKRGDVVLLKLPDLTCGMVDDTGQFVVAPGKNGLERIDLIKSWRIWSY